MTVRAPSPLVAVVGLAAATADELRRIPSLLHTARGAARERYDELALHGRDVLSGRHRAATPAPVTELTETFETETFETGTGTFETEVAEPATEVPKPAPPIGRTEPVELPEDVLEEVAQLPSGAELDHADLPLADFDHLTVPQLRGRLRTVSLPELVQLRDYEQAHAARLPILTMLDNRIAALTEQAD
jgi:hypothetical protein